MDIKEAILEEHSKAQMEIIVTYIGDNRDRFRDLMTLVLSNDDAVATRAAWVMSHCCQRCPKLSAPWIAKLIDRISEQATATAIKRNTIRILEIVDLPSDSMGQIFNLCYNLVNDPDETAAIRIYSMTVLGRICRAEPDLAEEVILLIKQHRPHGSAGFKGRARKILKELQKMQET